MLNKSLFCVSSCLLALLNLSLGDQRQAIFANSLPNALLPTAKQLNSESQTVIELEWEKRLILLEAQLKEERVRRSRLEVELDRLQTLIKPKERPAVANYTSVNQKALGSIGPKSCADYLSSSTPLPNGFYMVRSTDGKSVQVVYCAFTATAVTEEMNIGSVRVTSFFAVHFHVQRSESFRTPNAVIDFPLARELEPPNSNAFDLSTGVFTAPVAGIYRFSFSGVKATDSPEPLRVQLRKGILVIAEAYCTNLPDYLNSCSLEAVVELAAKESIELFNYGTGILFDSGAHLSQFTGSLLEERLE